MGEVGRNNKRNSMEHKTGILKLLTRKSISVWPPATQEVVLRYRLPVQPVLETRKKLTFNLSLLLAGALDSDLWPLLEGQVSTALLGTLLLTGEQFRPPLEAVLKSGLLVCYHGAVIRITIEQGQILVREVPLDLGSSDRWAAGQHVLTEW